jgi:hypothetical protein
LGKYLNHAPDDVKTARLIATRPTHWRLNVSLPTASTS